MKIFVTGGTGYIGSHTVVELQQSGFEVVIVDNLCNSNIQVLDGIEKITGIRPEFEQFDLTDAEATRDFFARHKDIRAVIHFAALKAVGESVEKPLEYYRNNLNSMMNVLASMREFGVKNLVFSSSCTVYGQADVLPVTEQTPRKQAESPYGNTKAMCEDIMRDLAKVEKEMNLIALRYFNPIGAHPSANIGELPNGVPNNLIPYLTIEEQFLLIDKINHEKLTSKKGIELLKSLDILDLKDKHPSDLSGGERQRAAIARALFNEPNLILADEPTASLDTEHAYQVVELLRQEAHLKNKATIMVTHDQRMIKNSDSIYKIEDGLLSKI